MRSYVKTSYRIQKRGPRSQFNIKITSDQYMKSHCGDKTIIRSSYLLLLFCSLRSGQNSCHFADNIFKGIFLTEKIWYFEYFFLLTTVPKFPIDKSLLSMLSRVMAWCWTGTKQLSPCMVTQWWISGSPDLNILMYCHFSNISRTQSQSINVSRIVLQLSLPNPWSQVLSWEWRCS